jgi:hypothetical protein
VNFVLLSSPVAGTLFASLPRDLKINHFVMAITSGVRHFVMAITLGRARLS